MAIPTVTAPLPAENVDPWITARNLLDTQLKATANGAAAAADALEISKASAADLDNVFAIASAAIPSSQKAAANGVATLGSDLKIPTAQLPALAVVEFLGSSANQAAMLAKVGQSGDWTTRTDLGTVWIITGADPTQLSSWTQMSYPTAPVTTVAGRTGAVVLVAGDIASGTFAAARIPALPISNTTGLQAALDAKVPTTRTVAGHDLSADIARAGLNTVGLGEAVFIPNGGTVPVGTPAYTIVIEAGA